MDKNWKLLVTTGYYWARLAGLQIVADIHSTEQFNALSNEKKQEIIDILKAKKVKAIVMYRGQKPVDSEEFKWTKMPQSGSYIYIIRDKKPDLTQDREADNACFSPESRPGQERESPSRIKD